MAPRPRSRKTAGLPPNLYIRGNGYFIYKNPATGEWFGLGRHKGIAVTQAVEANNHIQKQAITLLDRMTKKDTRTINDWCDEYVAHYGQHPRMKALRDGIGSLIIDKITPYDISQWLDKWKEKHRMREAMLSTAKKVLGEAIGKGWILTNPAAELTTPTPTTKRTRLTLETFNAIYAHAEPPLKRAMDIGLMTGMRRGNVVALQWSMVKDGYLWLEHIKDGLKIKVPLLMYLPDVNLTLGDAIARCRSSTVSRYLVHHHRKEARAKAGDPYSEKTIEQQFRDARVKAGITHEHPPTFHEVRSLAARLWKAQGIDVKVLLGHRSDEMSALYQDNRGIEWITLSA